MEGILTLHVAFCSLTLLQLGVSELHHQYQIPLLYNLIM